MRKKNPNMFLGHFLSYLVFTFALCHGQNYFFDKIKIRQDPTTTTSVIIEEKPIDNSTEFTNSSSRRREEPNDKIADENLSESVINIENLSFNSSKTDNVNEIAGESNRTDVEGRSQNHELNNVKNIDGELPFSALNSSLVGLFKERELDNIDRKRLASILKLMEGKPLPSVNTLQMNGTTSSNTTGTFSDFNSPLNDTNNDDTLYPNPDEVINQLSNELEELIKYHKAPYWEKMKHRIQFPRFYHTHGTISLPYDGIVEPFEAWYAGKYNMSRIDYYYGKLE